MSALTRRWIEQFVIAENLCPFAAPVLRQNQLCIAVNEAHDDRELALSVLDELELMQRAPEAELATSVLVFPHTLQDFERYLDFVALAEELLEACELDGIVQIASFHPQYCFADAAVDDVSNFTNRAPFPMLHFLRESALTRVLDNYPEPEAIPQRNIDHLQALGLEQVKLRLAKIHAGT
ncbi:MAG: hypothetical protein JWM78_3868 [Verrucomicrobiaceae bacterium]|nr:hypothetical protein [Verrucomicrobiaceae bacterium]